MQRSRSQGLPADASLGVYHDKLRIVKGALLHGCVAPAPTPFRWRTDEYSGQRGDHHRCGSADALSTTTTTPVNAPLLVSPWEDPLASSETVAGPTSEAAVPLAMTSLKPEMQPQSPITVRPYPSTTSISRPMHLLQCSGIIENAWGQPYLHRCRKDDDASSYPAPFRGQRQHHADRWNNAATSTSAIATRAFPLSPMPARPRRSQLASVLHPARYNLLRMPSSSPLRSSAGAGGPSPRDGAVATAPHQPPAADEKIKHRRRCSSSHTTGKLRGASGEGLRRLVRQVERLDAALESRARLASTGRRHAESSVAEARLQTLSVNELRRRRDKAAQLLCSLANTAAPSKSRR